jgi:hypothetical protein
MLQRLLLIAAATGIAPGGIATAQERFQLQVAGTTTESTAELTTTALVITHQGNASDYTRDRRHDAPGYLAFTNTRLRQVIRWPISGTGSMQIAELSPVGILRFRPSQMQITRIAPPVGAGPMRPRGGPVDATRSYRLTNESLGKSRSLAANSRGATTMDHSGDFANQYWRFAVAGKQTYRITNVALGDNFALTARTGNSPPRMMATDLQSQAQQWRLTPDGTTFRLTNEWLGTSWSLDHSPGGLNEPMMFGTNNMTGQLWTLTESPTAASGGIAGTWQEYDIATNRPTGINIEIHRNLALRQSEPGKPDRTGTVQLSGSQLSLNFAGGRPERYLVRVTADRIDFQDVSGAPAGFVWRRVAGTLPNPNPEIAQRISREVIPKPPLEPVTVELKNSHTAELWVLVSDLRDAQKVQRIRIPAGKSSPVTLERDAGALAVEVVDIVIAGLQRRREERQLEIPPQQLYDISVYEVIALSTVIDRTGKGPAKVLSVNQAPKSVGVFDVPPGDGLKAGTIDVYTVAKSQKNPGAVRRIDPADLTQSSP